MYHNVMIIDGSRIAQGVQSEVHHYVSGLPAEMRPPRLDFILIGNDPASETYVGRKEAACKKVGIISKIHKLSGDTSEKELIDLIKRLNEIPAVDGILVQFPLPKHINTLKITETISPDKDVDGFHPFNIGKVILGDPNAFVPCTPKGIIKLLEETNITLAGKNALVIGRSNIVGKPIASLLTSKNATVTIAHSKTENLSELCRNADIIIAALGSPHFIKADMVKKGAVIIDVGINRTDVKKLVGDVDFENVKELCSFITPVPGGVGPMTVAMLLENTVKAHKLHTQ